MCYVGVEIRSDGVHWIPSKMLIFCSLETLVKIAPLFVGEKPRKVSSCCTRGLKFVTMEFIGSTKHE